MEPKSKPEIQVLNTPFCGELRSKKFYSLQELALNAEDYLDPSNHCWCYHSQHTIGPDGCLVTPESCVPGRSCYRSALADPQST